MTSPALPRFAALLSSLLLTAARPSPAPSSVTQVMAAAPSPAAPVARAAKPKGGKAPKAVAPDSPSGREYRQRTLTLRDSEVGQAQEVHVARGMATLLVFPGPLKEHGATLVDVHDAFLPVQTTEKSVILVPKRELQKGEATALSVVLADSTELTFKLVSVPNEVDGQVQVELQLSEKASADSPTRLKTDLAACQLRLNTCRGNEGTAGVDKLADLVLARAIDSRPEAFVAEVRKARWIDRQSRLLVETHLVYRLFDKAYLVLTVENQDPSKEWVLDHTEVKLAGGGESVDVKVLSTLAQTPTLQSAAEGRYVVVFDTPRQQRGQKFDLSLLEKSGNRHVTLSGFEL